MVTLINRESPAIDLIFLIFGVLTPLSAIFQLYHGIHMPL
jgi:hypothetical protein